MKLHIINLNGVLSDVIEEVEKRWKIVGNIFDADKLVLWNDVMPDFVDVVNLAHGLGRKVITVQHGRWGTAKYFPPFNQKIVSDVLCVWGEGDKERLVKAGHPAERIKITGTSVFQHLKPRIKHEGVNIVFLPEHWGDNIEIEENRRTAEALRRIAKKHGFKITTKILEGHDKTIYDNPVFSGRDDPNHLEVCADVLSTADLVVANYEGTFEILAQYLDIPVVVCTDWTPKPCNENELENEGYLKYERRYSDACKKVDKPYRLEKAILQQLENPNELRSERRKVCERDGGILIKDPVKEIIKVIKKTK